MSVMLFIRYLTISLLFSSNVHAEKAPKSTAKSPVSKREEPPKIKSIQRNVDHRKAYENKKIAEEQLVIKVTPPGKRGKAGEILIEVYNNSNFNLATVKFDIEFDGPGYSTLSSTIMVEKMDPNWSDARRIALPKNDKTPNITKANVKNIEIFAYEANGVKSISLPFYVDLIKE